MKLTNLAKIFAVILVAVSVTFSQLIDTELKLKSAAGNDFNSGSLKIKTPETKNDVKLKLFQKPTK